MADNKKLDITLLYVEDDPETREEIAHFLKNKVSNLYTAENGKEGLEQYKQHKPTIIVTDIKMPIMNGLDMAREIKHIDKSVLIIITTAYNDTDLLIDCIDIGVNQFVLKPIILDKLTESIEKLLN